MSDMNQSITVTFGDEIDSPPRDLLIIEQEEWKNNLGKVNSF